MKILITGTHSGLGYGFALYYLKQAAVLFAQAVNEVRNYKSGIFLDVRQTQ